MYKVKEILESAFKHTTIDCLDFERLLIFVRSKKKGKRLFIFMNTINKSTLDKD